MGLGVSGVNFKSNIQANTPAGIADQQRFQRTEPYQPDTFENKDNNKNKKIAVGVIGTIAAGLAVWGLTKGRGFSKNGAKLEDLEKQAKDLRAKMKQNFETKKEAMHSEWLASKGSRATDLEESIIGKDKIESIGDCNKIIEEYRTTQMEKGMCYKKNKHIVDYFMIRLEELSKDKDFVKFKGKRSQIIEKFNENLKNNVPSPMSRDDYARIDLIDEVLRSKAKGQPTETLNLLDLSVDDAMKMIESENTNSILEEKLMAKFGYDWRPTVGTKCQRPELGISELFDDSYKYANAKEEVDKWQTGFDRITKIKETLQQRSQKLVNENRQSEDLKQLKELSRQMAELRK